MPLKYSFLILLFAASFKVNSQTLLSADLAKMKKEAHLQGKGLEAITIKKNSGTSDYKKVVVDYPIPPEGNTCIFRTTYYLSSKNKCFKYVSEYWGDELPIQKISELMKYYPHLKKVNNSKWIDNVNKTEINLIQDKKISAAYSLEIKSF